MGVEKARFRNPVIPDCELILKTASVSKNLILEKSESADWLCLCTFGLVQK